MSDTLTNLRADVRSHLDEASARFWSDAEVDRWINEAARDVARRAETLQTKATIATTAAVQDYSAPADTARLHMLTWAATGSDYTYQLEGRTLHEMDQVWGPRRTMQRSHPEFYAAWGYPVPTITLYPVPSVNGSLIVYYYKLPTVAVNASDLVEIPAGWHDLVPLYVEFVAKRKDNDPSWQEAKLLYEERIGSHVVVSRRWHDQAGMITPTGGYMPEWLVSME